MLQAASTAAQPAPDAQQACLKLRHGIGLQRVVSECCQHGGLRAGHKLSCCQLGAVKEQKWCALRQQPVARAERSSGSLSKNPTM